MPRSIWTGAVSFGLVNIPVKLYPATEQKDVRFHQLQKGTGKRIQYKRVAEGTNREVEYEDLVKGYELGKGKMVVIEPQELEAAEPERTHTIDIEDFVELGEIDPIHFEKSYYLAPAEGGGASKAYMLLVKAMEESSRVAIGRFVMRTKEYLVAIRPLRSGVLVLETLYFPDEIREIGDIPSLPAKATVTPRERETASRLVESLSRSWDPKRYHDTYRQRVLELIERKAEGDEIVVERTATPEPVTDLLAALEASLASARGKAAPKPKKKASTPSKASKAGKTAKAGKARKSA